MNYSIILKMVSVLLGIMSLAFSACVGVAMFYANTTADAEALPSWICILALTMMLALSFYLPSRNAPKRLFRKEALCVVGVGWIISVLVGTLPYILILQCSFGDGLFESASGLTTTGSSVFGDVEAMPRSLLFWRGLSQWIGGLGVVVFFVAILSFMGSSAKMMYSHEASASANGGIETERIKSVVFILLTLYTIISIACILSFKLCGMGWFDGICHMFATISTGGFSIYNNSIAHYNNNLIYWAVILFMFIGGISFFTMLLLPRGKIWKFFTNSELLTYTGILVCASLILAVIVLKDKDLTQIQSWGDAITQGAFQSVSLMTSTGFCTENYQLWLPVTHVILFALMIVGGCAGSTSGGLKVSRVMASFKLVAREIEKVLRPRVVRTVKIDNKIFDDFETTGLLSYITLYAIVAVCGTIAVGLGEPKMSFTGTLSSVITALSNVGPGFNEVGPANNFGFMNEYTKIVLSILMVMGRVEFYSILILFMPSLWKKFQ